MPTPVYSTTSLKEFTEQSKMGQLHVDLYTDFDGPQAPNDYGIYFLDSGDFVGLTPISNNMSHPEEFITRVLITYFQEQHLMNVRIYAQYEPNNPGQYSFIVLKA